MTRVFTSSLPVTCFKTCYKIPGSQQSQNEGTGKLGTAVKVGNLWRIRLAADMEAGPWKMDIRSTQPYTLKVTGQARNQQGHNHDAAIRLDSVKKLF